jgi:CheY-like chemotaxis protein
MRVLVAEDDDGPRSVLERGLRENGYGADALPDGERALAFLRNYEHVVAVVDWRLPSTFRTKKLMPSDRTLSTCTSLGSEPSSSGDRDASRRCGASGTG